MNPSLRRSLLALSAAVCGAAPAAAQASGFTPGELLFYDTAIPGLPTTSAGILRIDPSTGTTSLLFDLWSAENRADSLAYDPYRQRAIFYGSFPSHLDPNQVHLLDGFGNTTSLGNDGTRAHGFAPASGGRIYFQRGLYPDIQYLDANDQQHTLMVASGAQPYVPPSAECQSMEFHAGSNSLIVAVRRNSAWNCGGQNVNSQVLRLELSPDGSRVVGTHDCTELVVDPSVGNSPVGMSHGPNGALAVVVVTGSNASSPRMQLFDPATPAATAYAWNDYFGSAGTNGGTWSSVLGRVVIFDAFNDVLRSYGQGEVGEGTVINTSIPIGGGGSANYASLVEVTSGAGASSVGTYCTAKLTSDGCLPGITTSGSPSASATSGFTLEAAPLRANSPGIFFYGLNGPAAIPFQGGTLCAQPPVIRTPVSVSGGAGPCTGALSFDFNAYLAGGGNPSIAPGDVVHGQFWFRDPPDPVSGSGLSNGVTFTVYP